MKAKKRPALDDGTAFLPDPRDTGDVVEGRDTLAAMVTTEFLTSATSAEEQGEDMRDQVTPDELGGPFLEVSESTELGYDDDHDEEEYPKEPLPTAMRSE